jgi:hypothetical protein
MAEYHWTGTMLSWVHALEMRNNDRQFHCGVDWTVRSGMNVNAEPRSGKLELD